MTYPATTQTFTRAITAVDAGALQLKSFAISSRNAMAAGDVSANQIIQIVSVFKDVISLWASVKIIPGIEQFFRDQKQDQTIDIVAEFTAMEDAAIAVRTEILNTIPTDGAGWMSVVRFEADGNLTTRRFTSAQTAQLRVTLDAFIATIL